jgi:hypothetical protein
MRNFAVSRSHAEFLAEEACQPNPRVLEAGLTTELLLDTGAKLKHDAGMKGFYVGGYAMDHSDTEPYLSRNRCSRCSSDVVNGRCILCES